MELNIMKTSPAVTIRRTVLAALVAGGSALLVGCAGNPPTEQFAVTNTVVKSAVSAGGPQYAPVEMKNAQDKLAQAENLLREERYDEARRIAEQAEWDARVAERKALATKAQKTLDDAQKGVQQIREEGSRQPIIVQ
ncbi:DUF4398 domain-containing protein [Pseudomonas solani]|uniref:DUF4398 domain-containing protein n=1 Tax=Pseudomonas solani TaxID=2731552 RepID=A0AAU7Y214_9PSED|nr:DUF4398 domain-containing protein [Pseudomonas sp. PDM13]EQM69288.1 hypothetical protein L682_14185 [Pseudomonas alcaligenes OT 69]MCU9945990.1 DUF4398 domain-containing protein [Pseudomonas sp. PDM13]MDN4147675.1 DUF4398 domain-containing protein [Pseudomonas tohonis]